jgi:formylglycine-generating enzyme required for sulfatase activity
MALISEGEFWMGSEEGQEEERPVHRVWVDAFEMAVFQVRNRDYLRFVEESRYEPPPMVEDPAFSHPDQPVVAVSWLDAVAYCGWLSEVSGRCYRLPTEAEWERAARGGREGSRYGWGNEPPESVPDYRKRWQTGPDPVGRYPPNPFGLYNLGDNVHEWCRDWFDKAYYATSPYRNPGGPESGVRRASRGGSWRHHIKVSRCAARSSIPPDFRYADYGFRLVRDLAR